MLRILIIVLSLIVILGCNKDNPVEKHDEQFIQIEYESGLKDEVNTFEGFLQKDLVMDGTITVPFWLSLNEQTSILEIVQEIQFFSFPDTLYRQKGVSISPDFSPDKLRIKYGSQGRTVIWFYPVESDSVTTSRLFRLTEKIWEVINASSIYQKLPPVRGGYM